jgi:biotin-dependent carboxylase-like uncharacterized protein
VSAIEVVRIAGVATVQDAGRPGWMHQGVPPGGALVPELLARANLAVGNRWGAAAIELVGAIELAARGGDVVIATSSGEVKTLPDGEASRLPAAREARVGYVAVRGGLAVPSVLGGRGTLLAAKLGGIDGRVLQRGDRLPVGHGSTSAEGALPPSGPSEGAIGVVVGPDHRRFPPEAIAILLESPFLISPSSDRTGTRLRGAPPLPRLDRDSALSTPMVAGAIQVPSSGDPIVLGPDHPTTGGYPVLAVVRRADLGRFHALPLGSTVRFRAAPARDLPPPPRDV